VKFSKKYSSAKFHENPSSWSRVVPYMRADGWTNGHGEVNGRVSQFFDICIYIYIYIYIHTHTYIYICVCVCVFVCVCEIVE